MQKLSLELKNAPRDASLVPCSASSALNRDHQGDLSVQNKVLDDNNLEGNLPQNTGGFKGNYVFVRSISGSPLMPCSPAKARKLLKGGKAVVKKRLPFTIQLKFECENQTQSVSLGIDSGYLNIGFSASSEKSELISGEVKLDNQMPKRIQDKAMYRNTRRSRLWHRKPRWKNRVSTKKKGWLPPSTLRRYETHLNLIKKIKELLPISKTTVEVGNFDIQKINNPDISGKDYQQGNLYGYQNMKFYILSREKGRCQLCGKKYKQGNPWQLHHIISRSKGGTNKANNLALLHRSCHDRLHKEHLEKKLKKAKQFKDATFMSIIKWKFKEDLNCDISFGYQTSIKRNELNLEKSHRNDAFVISGASKQTRSNPFEIRQKRKNNRCLQKNRKGFRPSIRRTRYSLRPQDLIKVKNKIMEVIGVQNYGTYVRIRNDNKQVRSISIKKLDGWKFHTRTLNWKLASC